MNDGGIIEIPQGLSRFAIHMCAEGDTVFFRFSSARIKPLILYAGGRWNVRCYERIVNDIRVNTSVKGRGYIIVEAL